MKELEEDYLFSSSFSYIIKNFIISSNYVIKINNNSALYKFCEYVEHNDLYGVIFLLLKYHFEKIKLSFKISVLSSIFKI